MPCKCDACQAGRSIEICCIEGCDNLSRSNGSNVPCQEHYDDGFEYKGWLN